MFQKKINKTLIKYEFFMFLCLEFPRMFRTFMLLVLKNSYLIHVLLKILIFLKQYIINCV